jgi:hypothetical protein
MWREAPAEVRQKYIRDEAAKREAYKAAMALWKEAKGEEIRAKQQEYDEATRRVTEDGNNADEEHSHGMLSSVDDTMRSSFTSSSTLQQPLSLSGNTWLPGSYFPNVKGSPPTGLASCWPAYQSHPVERLKAIMHSRALVDNVNAVWSKSSMRSTAATRFILNKRRHLT